MSNPLVFAYGGYFSTGGAVVRDIFQEFEPRFDMPCEFRLLREKGAILDLDNAINNNMSPEIVGLAVREFLWITDQLSRNAGRFTKAGFSYNKLTNGKFKELTRRYVNSLVDYEYPMNWHYHVFKKNYFRQIIDKVYKKVFVKNTRTFKGNYIYPLITLNEKEFIEKIKIYFNFIFNSIREYREIDEQSPVGIHNAVSNLNPLVIKRVKKFIPNLKVFIVDRDPRDIYLNLSKDSYSRYLPSGISGIQKVEAFIRFYKSIRIHKEEIKKLKNVYFYKFEDFICDYDKTISRLFFDANLDPKNHVLKFRYFKPEKSKDNMHQWKSIPKNLIPEIKLIEKDLNKYFYN